MRHRIAVGIACVGVSVKVVQEMLGHSSRRSRWLFTLTRRRVWPRKLGLRCRRVCSTEDCVTGLTRILT